MRLLASSGRVASCGLALALATSSGLAQTRQSMPSKGVTINTSACQALAGGAMFTRCGPTTLSDGKLRLRTDSDLDGSGGKPQRRPANEGKPCEVTVASGVVTMAAGDFKATAALDGEPNDRIIGSAEAGAVTVNNAQDKLQISLEYSSQSGLSGAQTNVGSRSVTCLKTG